MAGGASRAENMEAMVQQFMDNVGDRQPAPQDSGDARERQLQKSQLTDDAALWKKMASRKHWVLRGRIPPNIGDSAADIQSFVGEAVNVTTSVATQLRAISDFDVRPCRPRAEGMVDHLLMVADRLDFLRQALVAVLSVGFSLDSDGDRHCRETVATIDAAFTSASADLRRHTLSNIILLSGPTARAVMSEMVNDDLRLWVNDLMRFAQRARPPMVPPPSDFTFSMPSVPSFKRTSAFCYIGGDVLKLVEGLHVPRDSQDGPSKRKSNPASPGTPKKKNRCPVPIVCCSGPMPVHQLQILAFGSPGRRHFTRCPPRQWQFGFYQVNLVVSRISGEGRGYISSIEITGFLLLLN